MKAQFRIHIDVIMEKCVHVSCKFRRKSPNWLMTENGKNMFSNIYYWFHSKSTKSDIGAGNHGLTRASGILICIFFLFFYILVFPSVSLCLDFECSLRSRVDSFPIKSPIKIEKKCHFKDVPLSMITLTEIHFLNLFISVLIINQFFSICLEIFSL